MKKLEMKKMEDINGGQAALKSAACLAGAVSTMVETIAAGPWSLLAGLVSYTACRVLAG
jgi:hypothetical protein